MKKRYCFNCGKVLVWSEFRFQNSHMSVMYLKELWKNNKLEFFCCKCFKEEMLISRNINSDFIPKKEKNNKRKEIEVL